MRWEAHTDVSQTREFLNRVVSDYEKPDFYRWAVVLKSDKKAIGAVGLQVVSEYDSVADVSYVLGGRTGTGIASEALRRSSATRSRPLGSTASRLSLGQ